MSESLPDLHAKLRLDTSELDKAVKHATTVGSAIGSTLGSVAGGALTRVADSVATFASGSVDAFAQLEDATAAAGVVFGQNVDDIVAKSQDAAAKAGVSGQQFIDAALTFGTFGKQAGLQGKPLADFSGNLTQLAADMASFRGTTPEQAIEAVGAALRGESEPIRQYGVLLDEATLQQEAQRVGLVKASVDHTKVASAKANLALAQQRLTKVMHDSKATDAEKASAQAAVGRAEAAVKSAVEGTTPKLTQQQRVLAAQSAILRQTKDAQGDFARTSDSTANTQKRLAAETANAQAQLGQRLAPAMTALRLAIITVVTSLADFLSWVQQNIGVIGPLVALIAFATVVLNAHAIAVSVVSTATRIWTAVQAALNFVMSANPLGLIIIAIAALVAGIIIAYQHSETFRNIVQAVWAAIKAAVSAVISWLSTAVPAVFAWIKNAFLTYTPLGIIISHWGQIRAFIAAAVAAIRGIIGWFAQLPGMLGRWFAAARDASVRKLDDLLSFVRSLPGRITSALGNLGGLLLNAGRDVVQGLINGIKNAAGAVADAARELASHIPGPIRKLLHIGSPSRLMRDIGQDTGAGLELGLLDSVPSIASAASQLVDAALPSSQLSLATSLSVGAGGSQLVELSPASLAALAAALPDVLVQVLLDSELIAAKVDTKLGSSAAAIDRGAGFAG